MERGKKKNYYIHLESGKWQKVKGRKVKIKGFEDLDLFYHKEDGYYCITEGKTGSLINKSEFLDIAKEQAQDMLTKAKIKGTLAKAINEAIIEYGLSPRYRRSKHE